MRRFERVENPSKAKLEFIKLDWTKAVKSCKGAFAGIKPILGNKIDVASLEIIAFLATGLFAGEI